MIEADAFVSSWSLFAESYLVGAFSAALLALLGAWVVGRRQIFLGAAIAQASGLGVAAALSLQMALGLETSEMTTLVPLLAATSGGLVGLLVTGGAKAHFDEGIVAWVFLVGASVSVLLVAHHPEGLEIIHRLLFSTILGSTWSDVVLIGCTCLFAGILAYRFYDSIALLALDPDASSLAGISAPRWSRLISLFLGVAVGLVMQATGFLYTFGCLVLPVLAARAVCREIRQLLWVAPLLAVVIAVFSFGLAYLLDLPPAQVTVAVLALCVLLFTTVMGRD